MLRVLNTIAISLLLTASLWGQSNSDLFAYPSRYSNVAGFMRDTRQLTFNRMPGVSTDYSIGAGDVIAIEVVDVPHLDYRATVDNRGMVRFPAIGEIRLEGMTALDLETILAEKLKEKELVRNPEVLVHILEYAAKPYYVVGEVDRPGEYTMTQTVTLMDALLISGGIDASAGGLGFLHRRRDAHGGMKPNTEALLRNPEQALPGTDLIAFDIERLKTGGVLEKNPVLQAGDTIVVPRRTSNTFYVVGDVVQPGPYEITEGSSLSIGQAIAQAGGPLKTAKQDKGVLIRQDETGRQLNIPINFRSVLLGKADDLALRRNDVVFIPGSASRTMGYGLLGNIPGTMQRSITTARPRIGGAND